MLQEAWPQGTNQAGDKAVQTPLRDGRHASISFPEASSPRITGAAAVPYAYCCCAIRREDSTICLACRTMSMPRQPLMPACLPAARAVPALRAAGHLPGARGVCVEGGREVAEQRGRRLCGAPEAPRSQRCVAGWPASCAMPSYCSLFVCSCGSYSARRWWRSRGGPAPASASCHPVAAFPKWLPCPGMPCPACSVLPALLSPSCPTVASLSCAAFLCIAFG